MALCRLMGKQLPSDEKVLDSYAWYGANSGNITHNVKQKDSNTLGVYDMFGNVTEWAISGYDPLFIVTGGSYDTK